MALAYNVVSGVARTYGEADSAQTKDEWKASFDDEWIVGTLDYGQVIFDTPWVDDLKTGRFVTWEDYEKQQTFYCAAYSLVAMGAVVDTRSTLTHWPRYPVYKKPSRFGYLLEAAELKAFLKSLKEFRNQALAQKPSDLVTGEHCRFCPSRGNCSAYEAMDTKGVDYGGTKV